MKPAPFLSQKVNRYFPHIFLIGMSIGTANFLIHGLFNWFQWIILSLCTSLLIGYGLLSIAAQRESLQEYFQGRWKLYGALVLAFLLLGVIASELENIIKYLLFSNESYQAFSAGSTYLINGIISTALGLSFFFNAQLFPSEAESLESAEETLEVENQEVSQPIAKIPVKKGETILLIAAEEIAYFEAYDNYAFVFDLQGNKMLCDYSLLFLEKRLGHAFIRIHRKFIVNTRHIKQIKPQLNSRYLIEFDKPQLESISSSKSYAASIRSLIKIE